MKFNSTWGVGNVLQRMGIIAYYQGEQDEALRLFRSILASRPAQNAINNSLDAVFGVGMILRANHHLECAVRLFAAINNLLEKLGMQLGTPERHLFPVEVTTARGQMSDLAFHTAWANGCVMSLEQAVYFALCDQEPAISPSVE